jgi:hypothetical protein
VLISDACSRLLITIKFHNLHVVDIRGVVGEIVSYHKKDYHFFFLWVVCLLAFLWPSLFFSLLMVLAIDLLLNFCVFDLLKKYVAILLSMESQIFGDRKASK